MIDTNQNKQIIEIDNELLEMILEKKLNEFIESNKSKILDFSATVVKTAVRTTIADTNIVNKQLEEACNVNKKDSYFYLLIADKVDKLLNEYFRNYSSSINYNIRKTVEDQFKTY